MSLIQPLLKGLTQPLLIPTTGLPADYWDAVAALGEKWGLNGSLLGSNGTPVTFTRASQKIYQDSQGKWRSYAVDTPAYGVGLSLEGSITNKCTNFNFAPDAGLTSVSDNANCTTARVLIDDVPEPYQSQIRAAFPDTNIAPWNGYVFCSAGAASGTATATISGATGNTNTHVGSVFAVRAGGDNSALLRVTAQASENVEIMGDSSFQRWVLPAFTPSDGARTIQVRVPNNGAVYWFGNQLEESQIETSPIATTGGSATRALDDAQVSTAGMPVQDCAYYIELPRGVRDNGLDRYIFESRVDADNTFRLFYQSSNARFRAWKENAAVTVIANADYVADGSPVAILIKNSSVDGFSIELSNGEQDSKTNTDDIVLNSIVQFGADDSGSMLNPLFAEEANFKYFNTSDITLEAAALV